MNATEKRIVGSNHVTVEALRAQQKSYMEFLFECISVREKYPQYAPRVDAVISSVEMAMSQNAILLARLEAMRPA